MQQPKASGVNHVPHSHFGPRSFRPNVRRDSTTLCCAYSVHVPNLPCLIPLFH